jgi:hypothetical protein
LIATASWVSCYSDFEAAEQFFWKCVEAGLEVRLPLLANDLSASIRWTGPIDLVDRSVSAVHLPEDPTAGNSPELGAGAERDTRLTRQLQRWQSAGRERYLRVLHYDPVAGERLSLRRVGPGLVPMGRPDGHTLIGYVRYNGEFGRFALATTSQKTLQIIDRLAPENAVAEWPIDPIGLNLAPYRLRELIDEPVLRRLPAAGEWWTAEPTGLWDGKQALCGLLPDNRLTVFLSEPYGARPINTGQPGRTTVNGYAARKRGLDSPVMQTVDAETAHRAAEIDLSSTTSLTWTAVRRVPSRMETLLREWHDERTNS